MFGLPGKTPEEVVKRYLQKVRNPPEEVRTRADVVVMIVIRAVGIVNTATLLTWL